MDTLKYKLFKHLATTLHFGQTSHACNITPSALTRTIQRLEEQIGKKLFTRDNRSVKLTQAGIRFRQYVDESLKNWQKLQNDLSADEKILRGDIAIYSSVTAVHSLLPRILRKYRDTFPEVHIKLQTGDAAHALSKLENGEAEVTIAALPEKIPADIEFIRLTETPLLFIAPENFLIGEIHYNNEIDWLKTPVIMAERGLGRKRLDQWFKNKNIQPNIYAQVAGNEAIIAMVSLGCGIGVVPKLVLDKSPMRNQVVTLEMRPKLKPFSVSICTTKKNMDNHPIKAFWNIASSEIDPRHSLQTKQPPLS